MRLIVELGNRPAPLGQCTSVLFRWNTRMQWQPTEERESLVDVSLVVVHSRCSPPAARARGRAKAEDDGGISLTRRLQVANLHRNGLAQRPFPEIAFG
jgi:hypothetical protein